MKIINELFRLSELNQKQFAEKHKIEESLFGKYLKGKAVPRKSTLDRIANTEGYVIQEKLIAKNTQEIY
jgi:transcriptional regulator with XRE-family HTH domain